MRPPQGGRSISGAYREIPLLDVRIAAIVFHGAHGHDSGGSQSAQFKPILESERRRRELRRKDIIYNAGRVLRLERKHLPHGKRIEDAIPAANHRFLERAVSEAKTRRPVVVVTKIRGIVVFVAGNRSGIAGQYYRRASGGVGEIYIRIASVFVGQGRIQLVTDAQVKSELAAYLPIVLEETRKRVDRISTRVEPTCRCDRGA